MVRPPGRTNVCESGDPGCEESTGIDMTDLPIWIIEPEQTDKRELAALRLSRGGQKAAHIPPAIGVAEIKQKIRLLRESARANIDSLATALETSFKDRYPGSKVVVSSDAGAAVDYVSLCAGAVKTISTNNSAAVQELRPGLVRNGFTVINSYHSEFDVKEKKVLDYWDLPRMLDKGLEGTFDVAVKLDGLPRVKSRDYVAVLGVNAASADDGTVLFLEHFSNIRRDLEQAAKVVLVIGLDKVVATRAEATFQAQCMGIFGMENILLGIEPRPARSMSIDDLPLPVGDRKRELHIIILDNGRRKMIDGKFGDLFLCIGCRACNKHCPIRHAFKDAGDIWTPKIYLTSFLRADTKSVDVCLHCEGCRMECPVDIDLPYLMWQAKLDYVARHGTSFSHKVLGRPELLARLGTGLAPLANWAMRRKLVRVPMEGITGIDRRTTLPHFFGRTFRNRSGKDRSAGGPRNG